jgi:hypothetical protein
VGLQFFPLRDPSVPEQCTSDAECGPGGVCFLNVCDGVNVAIPCRTAADCPPVLSNCVPLGECSGNPQMLCPASSPLCGIDPVTGQDLGMCNPVTVSECLNATSCDAKQYATPEVEIAELPGNAAAISGALVAKTPEGLTPTGPALRGAIDYAAEWQAAHPGHTVIVLLATDGLPTECPPIEIDQVANYATAGAGLNPPIRTYVIGVFSPVDTDALANLNTLAAAGGGTNEAFIVDPSQDVTAQFLEALDDIRSMTLSCEYQIPPPAEGEDLNYFEVNMVFTDGGQSTTLSYVDTPDNCDKTDYGWYYDVSEEQILNGTNPTKIIVCDETCDIFEAATSGKVDIQIGCAISRIE